MTAKNASEELSLEQLMEALDETIEQLEGGELPLSQSFELYKKGCDLLVKCNGEIDRVEKELMVLEGN